MKEMFANSVNEELALWQSLITHEGWIVFQRMIRWRKDVLVKDILAKMRLEKINEAQDSRSGYDELNKLLSLVSDRMEVLQIESNKEEQ